MLGSLAALPLLLTATPAGNILAAAPERVPVAADGGVYSVPVQLNEVLRMDLVIDTGAAFVMIPADVALTLKRTGTLTTVDRGDAQEFVLADGSVVKKRRVVLRSLQVGSRQLENVEAIVGGLKSPLLLGQSALRHLEPRRLDTRGGHLLLLEGPPHEAPPPARDTTAPTPQLTAQDAAATCAGP